jgi:hypothetical protein
MSNDQLVKVDHQSPYDSPFCACLPIGIIVVVLWLVFGSRAIDGMLMENQSDSMSEQDIIHLLNTHSKQLDQLVSMCKEDLHTTESVRIDEGQWTPEGSADAQHLATYRSLLHEIGGTQEMSLNAQKNKDGKGGYVAVFSTFGPSNYGLVYSDTALTEENDGDGASGTRTTYRKIYGKWYTFVTYIP